MTIELKPCNWCGADAPCTDQACQMNTRSTPSPVPELVRYKYNPYSNHGCQTELMEVNPDGTYVLASEAERIIADLVKEIYFDKALGITYKSLCETLNEECEKRFNRAGAAEAKLAENEKPAPVAYTLIFRESYGINAETTFKKFEAAEKYAVQCELPTPCIIPLYAHPVADREAETIERLCAATQLFCDAYTDESSDPNHYILLMQTAWENAQEPLRALSGKEPS